MEEYRQGRAYLEAKDYARAVQHLSNSIAIMPSSGAYMDLGISYNRLKRYSEAVESFKQVARTAPNNPDVHYWLASTYFNMATEAVKNRSKDMTLYQNAEAEARETIRLRANPGDAYFILANSLYAQGKYAEAVPAAEQSVRTQPNDQANMFILAIAYAKVGRKADAMRVYERLAGINPEYAATVLSQINNITASNTGATSATATTSTRPTSTSAAAPGSAEYYVNEGARLRDAEKYAQAIASFKRAIALKPSLALAHFNLGYCQYMLKQYALALPAFQQTVKLEPNDSSNHYWLGATYHQLKRYQPALASLQEAIRLKPDDAYSHHWLGDVYAEGFKQYDKAIPEYLESIRFNPQYAIPRNQLGLAYTETDELELALSAFQGAIKLKPAEPLYYSNLGYTYLWMGRREDAVAVQRKLQTLDQAKAKTLADSIEATFPADNDNAGFLGVLAVVVSDRPATALTIYRRILLISTTPDEKAGAYRGMGAAYKAKGNERKALAAYQQALPIYQRLVRLKPNEGYLLSGLARTYVGLGQRDQALQIYKRLQTIAPDHAKDVLNELNKAK
jgi:superkiller protein 3